MLRMLVYQKSRFSVHDVSSWKQRAAERYLKIARTALCGERQQH